MFGRARMVRLALAAFVVTVVASTAGAQNDATFSEAVDLFRRGQVEEARQKLEEILASNPSNNEALALYHSAEEEIWLRMLLSENDALQAVVKRFGELARQGRKEKSGDDAAISEHVEAIVGGDFAARQRAMLALASNHGSHAVKGLWKHLGDDSVETRVRSIVALQRLGSDALLPLVAVTKADDERVRANACAALGSLGDTRAGAALAVAAESDASAVVRRQAQAALESLGVNGQPAALWVERAESLLEAGAAAARPGDGVFAIWTLEGGDLGAVETSPGLYHLALAEQASFAALDSDPNNADAIRVLATTYAAQLAQVRASGEGDDDTLTRLTVALAACGEASLRSALSGALGHGGLSLAAAELAEALGNLPATQFAELEAALGSTGQAHSLRGGVRSPCIWLQEFGRGEGARGSRSRSGVAPGSRRRRRSR